MLEDRLHNLAVESNIAKNKQFADIKTRLMKCEEVLKLQSWNEERIKILNEQVRTTQRQIDKEVDHRVLPIEKRMHAMNNQITSMAKVSEYRPLQAQHEDVLQGALGLLNKMDRLDESHFAQSPGYLTDIKGARRRRNSTLGMYADTQESSKE